MRHEQCACGARLVLHALRETWPAPMLGHVMSAEHQDWRRRNADRLPGADVPSFPDPYSAAVNGRAEMPRNTVEQMRAVVLIRDGGCIASRLDPDAGPCYDRWGNPLEQRYDVEIDYIERRALGPRHALAIDHVSLCAGHHRGTGPQKGVIWAKQTGRREALRRYLDRL